MAWGGGTPAAWRAEISLSGGRVLRQQTLATRPFGRSILRQPAGIVVQSLVNVRYEAIDVEIEFGTEANLQLQMFRNGRAAIADGEKSEFSIPLTDILNAPFSQPIDDAGNRLVIQRAPGDELRVRFARDHLVFSPGETFSLDVMPNLAEPPNESTRVFMELVRQDSRQVLQRDARALESDGVNRPPMVRNWAIELPREEGVYEIVFRLAQSRHIFQNSGQIERSVQIVVVDPRPEVTAGSSDWEEVLRFDAAQPRWWESLTKIPAWNRLPLSAKRDVGEGAALPWQIDDQLVNRLEPGTWQAYPLPGARPGMPHVLEVTCPGEAAQSLAVSITEPELGETESLSGVATETVRLSHSDDHRVRLIFWPRTRVPYVLLNNVSDTEPAFFRSIAMSRNEQGLANVRPRQTPVGYRQAMAYYPTPNLSTLFSPPLAEDRASGRALTDWHSFDVGSNRLVEFLNHAGYTGAVMGSLVDGSALFPTQLSPASARFDTGAYFNNGQDPVSKDVLELMFRKFDRAGLQLVPLIRFSAPLGNLAAQQPATQSGLVLVNDAGQPYNVTGTELGWSCNPLDPRVQQSMETLVREIVHRYAHHKSFGGLCIEMGPDTYTHLPGKSWGYDPATVSRFFTNATAEGKQVLDPQQQQALLRTEPQQISWMRWRAQQMTELYRRLTAQVRSARADASVYLATARLLDTRTLRGVYRPALGPKKVLQQALLEMGLELDAISQIDGLRFQRPFFDSPSGPLTLQGPGLELAASEELSQRLKNAGIRGVQSYTRSRRVPWPFLGRDTEETDESRDAVIGSMPVGAERRSRLARAIIDQEANVFLDGMVSRACAQTEDLQKTLKIFQSLPDAPFADVQTPNGAQSPVIVRTFSRGNRTYLYAVNDSPWPMNATVRLTAAANSQALAVCTECGPLDWQEFEQSYQWNLELKPYDLDAVVVNAGSVEVIDLVTKAPPEAAAQIQSKLTELIFRVGQLAEARPDNVLGNPGFEFVAGPQIVGWDLPVGAAGGQAVVDPTVKRSGERSLRLSSSGAVSWIRSAPFPAPATGRLSIQVWLRIPKGQQVPPLRLAVEGQLDNQPYYRYARIAEGAKVGEWVQFALHVDDLPSHELKEMRVRFDMMGTGTAWLDDITIFSGAFTRLEQIELSKVVALADLQFREGRLSACAKTLARYWPRFLLEQLPGPSRVATTKAPVEEKAKEASDAKSPADEPTTLDRLRRLVPRF